MMVHSLRFNAFEERETEKEIYRIKLIICRYTEVSNNVQKEDTVLNIEFVLLDCSPLKFALLSHCNEWQNKFTTLLKNMATERLKELTAFLKENAEK